ncbi:MAG: ATPase, T2SS/T4P/T4SS family [Candidatus Micrarchaeaceae archaeon]
MYTIIYFSKRISMGYFGLISERLFKRSAPDNQNLPSRMSFEIIDGYAGGEEVERIESGINRSVVRCNNAYIYVVGTEEKIEGRSLKAMGLAKSAVIEELARSEREITIELLPIAKSIAKESLIKLIDPQAAERLSFFVAHDTVGYGPFSILMEDKSRIEEIEVNSTAAPISVYLSKYGRCSTNLIFLDQNSFKHNINKLVTASEKELSEDSPIIDAQVGDARLHAQIKPYAVSGAAASIRMGGKKDLGIGTLVREGTLNEETLAYLWLAIDAGLSIVISGAPASGKTTLLSALCGLISASQKVITIEEEIDEIKLNRSFSNVVALYGGKFGITTREQVINALRLRPERLIIGEIRGSEAKDLFSGSNLGIPFITTMHAKEDPYGVIKRLMVSPMDVEVRSISMLDLSVHMLQFGINRRRVNSVCEYRWLSRAETFRGQEVGEDAVEVVKLVENGALVIPELAKSKVIAHFGSSRGYSAKKSLDEFERRVKFLKATIAAEAGIDARGLLERYNKE